MAGFPAISFTSGLSKLNVTVLFDTNYYWTLDSVHFFSTLRNDNKKRDDDCSRHDEKLHRNAFWSCTFVCADSEGDREKK